MKKLLFLGVIALGFWMHRDEWIAKFSPPASVQPAVAGAPAGDGRAGAKLKVAETQVSQSVAIVQFTDVLQANLDFRDLAKPGYYTVVEVYLDTCAICRRLETSYPAFLQARSDVLVRKVHFPEGGMQLSIQGSTQEEMQRNAESLNARVQSFEVCGTPHIEVFDPQGKLVARDACTKKQGLAYLRNWIGSELGRPASTI